MIPLDLGPKAIAMFDGLLSRGLLFYAETQAEPVSHDGFQFEFRVSPVLKKKPILARDAPGRSQAQGPFVDPDREFVVAEIGTGHILELNMHCVHRPAFVLHTRLFAPQTDDLDATDIAAVRAVMENLRGSLGPQMAIYNCGFDAGSSQGHKHMQVFPLPSGVRLYPEIANSATDIEANIPGVPFQHFALRLEPRSSPGDVHLQLKTLVSAAQEAHARCGNGQAYNVAMSDDWICVVPRRHNQKDGIGANGAGMLGLVWVRDRAEREGWDNLGLSNHLACLGIPKT